MMVASSACVVSYRPVCCSMYVVVLPSPANSHCIKLEVKQSQHRPAKLRVPLRGVAEQRSLHVYTEEATAPTQKAERIDKMVSRSQGLYREG